MATTGHTAADDRQALHEKYLAERDKRLRRDADAQYLAAEGAFADFDDDPYAVSAPVRDPVIREIDTVIVGGGFGGLLTAARLTERDADDFLLIERAADFGGTWYWNRYPGVRCDIESYIYMPLLEEVGTVPTERYATGPEIFEHCRAIGRHYGLYERALLQTRVTRMEWRDEDARWLVETDRGDRISARFVTVSQGPLAKVKLPGIPGIRDFEGPVFHSSRWDYHYTGGDTSGELTTLAGKRVAVIGTGATAVQIVPKIAESGAELYVFQRTPSAIDERNNVPTDETWFRSQPKGWLKERRDNFLAVITAKPHAENKVADRWTDFWSRFGARMAEMRAAGGEVDPHEAMQAVDYAKMDEIRARVSQLVADPERAERLKPWYNYLCKRPLYSDHFLQAFDRPNVHLVDTEGQGVERITAAGLVAGGREYPVDLIVFATGFDVGAPPHEVGGYDVVGRDGRTLREKWDAGLRSVHGTQMAGFPNFHLIGGTAQGTTAFNFTHTLDMQATHAADILRHCLENGVVQWEVTPEAEDRWLAQLEARHVDHEHFYEECTPGFLNNEGAFRDRPTFVGATYGGGPIEYEALIAAWRDHGWREDVAVRRGATAQAA